MSQVPLHLMNECVLFLPRHLLDRCRVTSLMRKRAPLGPYSRTIPGVLWWSLGGGSICYERDTPVEAEAAQVVALERRLQPRPTRFKVLLLGSKVGLYRAARGWEWGGAGQVVLSIIRMAVERRL